jgi:hypothetical protein
MILMMVAIGVGVSDTRLLLKKGFDLSRRTLVSFSS